MNNIPAGLVSAIENFAALDGPLLIATDFDGVLAPLVDDPTRSRPLPASSTALAALQGSRAGRVHTAYISGRRINELAQLASPAPGTHLYGTHGAQSGRIRSDGSLEALQIGLSPEQHQLLESAVAAAQALAETARGAWVEHKETSVVLHTRLASEQDTTRVETEFRAFVHTLGAHVILGHDVTEVSATDNTKGKALSQLRNELGAQAVIYFGDDITDETVFNVLNGPDIGIKVGPGDTAAGFRVENPAHVAFVLQQIADKVIADQ